MGEGCGQWTGPAQNLVQTGGTMAGKMLGDQNCRWKLGRQSRTEEDQSLHTPCRRTNGHDVAIGHLLLSLAAGALNANELMRTRVPQWNPLLEQNGPLFARHKTPL
jgi:hypothetical protein